MEQDIITISQQLLIRLVIKDYIRKIKLSDSRRAIYYKWNGKEFSKKLPKKYQTTDYKIGYSKNIGKGKQPVLVNATTGQPVIANPKVSGTEKWVVINGQKIYNNEIDKWRRNVIVSRLKDYFSDFISQLTPLTKENYPLSITYIFYDDFSEYSYTDKNDQERGKDLDNHSFIYAKCFQDCLVDNKIIKNDHVDFINMITYRYIKSSEPRLEILISKNLE